MYKWQKKKSECTTKWMAHMGNRVYTESIGGKWKEFWFMQTVHRDNKSKRVGRKITLFEREIRYKNFQKDKKSLFSIYFRLHRSSNYKR